MTRNSKTLTDNDRAALASLTLPQAMAVAKLVSREPDRITVRDCLLRCLHRMMPGRGAINLDAHRIADELESPGDGPHGDLLRTIAALSRRGTPPAVDRLSRVLAAAGRSE
jgi:hypothetical protein